MNLKVLYIGAGALFLVLFLKSTISTAAVSTFDLSSFNDTYGSDNVARLQTVLNALAQAGYSGLVLQMMLSQILQETGLFTSNPNYNATDNDNNYAGISSGGSLKAYNSVNDFVTDYVRVLSLGSNPPIQATDIVDFNNRLKANGYYTDSQTTYGNNLITYFNLLNQI